MDQTLGLGPIQPAVNLNPGLVTGQPQCNAHCPSFHPLFLVSSFVLDILREAHSVQWYHVSTVPDVRELA